MQRIFIALIVIAAAAFSLIYLFQNKVEDIRPAVFPVINNPLSQNPTTSSGQQTGTSPDIPLKVPEGLKIGVFANNLKAPRDIVMTPNQTLIVSLTSSGKVVALKDTNNDGVADIQKELISGLKNPHGLLLYKGTNNSYQNKLIIAEEEKLNRYSFDEEKLELKFDKELIKLPKGGRHFTRTLEQSSDDKLFVSVGSSCDVCFEQNPQLASVIVTDMEGNNPQIFSSGLRNAVFLKFDANGKLWTTEMGRDFLGDTTPPDEINVLEQDKNYGWPICYGNKIHDTKFDDRIYAKNPCDTTISPVFEIPSHSAPLGLNFINSSQFPSDWQGDLLVSYHGSWNSSTPVGYKVVRLNVEGNLIVGSEDLITGFLQGSQALGRPVDLEFDSNGSLYISDDKANVIYKLVKN